MARKSKENSKAERKYSLSKLYYWMVGHRSRPEYWTCGGLAKWIRFEFGVTPKPHAATAEDWDAWHKANKAKFGYWLAEEGLDYLQDIWMFIPDVYRRVKYYIRNRYIDKPHYLDTKLKRGEWYEFDTRLLHGMFEALVDFVEDEKAAMFRWTSDEKFKLPNAEKGIEYLKWEMTLAEEKPDDPDWHPVPEQAARAKETLDLYNWWKYTRPLRKEPFDAVGLSDWYDKMAEKYDDADGTMWSTFSRKYSEEDEAEHKRLHDASIQEETRQYEEDSGMMIRLVKLRQDLWT